MTMCKQERFTKYPCVHIRRKIKKMNKIIDTIKMNALKARVMIPAAAATVMAHPMMASAFDSVTVNQQVSADPFSMLGKIIGIILTFVMFVGIALVVYGIIDIAMSFTQDQPEKKLQGIKLAFAGAIMIGLKVVLQATGLIA